MYDNSVYNNGSCKNDRIPGYLDVVMTLAIAPVIGFCDVITSIAMQIII